MCRFPSDRCDARSHALVDNAVVCSNWQCYLFAEMGEIMPLCPWGVLSIFGLQIWVELWWLCVATWSFELLLRWWWSLILYAMVMWGHMCFFVSCNFLGPTNALQSCCGALPLCVCVAQPSRERSCWVDWCCPELEIGKTTEFFKVMSLVCLPILALLFFYRTSLGVFCYEHWSFDALGWGEWCGGRGPFVLLWISWQFKNCNTVVCR